MKEIVIGTRGSALALWQTNWVKDKLAVLLPEHYFKVVRIKTEGDKIRDAPLAQIGGDGIFVRQIEYALLREEIDMAVHSMKDLPTTLPDGLTVGAITERFDPSDALISNKGYNFSTLPLGAKIGTSSVRRRAQLLHFRPDLKFENLRGNVDTRIAKLKFSKGGKGGFDAIVLASAGIKRLAGGRQNGLSPSTRIDLEGLTIEPLSYDICLSAAGQGAIGIEVREKDNDLLVVLFRKPSEQLPSWEGPGVGTPGVGERSEQCLRNQHKSELLEILKQINHFESYVTVTAERALLKSLGGGCQIPIAALGTIDGGTLSLEGLVADVDGNRIIRSTASGKLQQAEAVGKELAKILIDMGAKSILFN